MMVSAIWCYVTRANGIELTQPIKQATLTENCIHHSRSRMPGSYPSTVVESKTPLSLWVLELHSIGQLQEIMEEESTPVVLYPPANEDEEYFGIYILPDGTKLYNLTIYDDYIE